MIVVETKGLAVGYGQKIVVDDIAINALKGQMLCLLGPNGSGKTTILRTLSGLLSSVNGTVYINGEDIRKLKENKLAKKLSVVLTERPTTGLMTVFEMASMGRYPHTGFFGKLTERDIKITMDALKLVNAQYLADRYFTELSDGERQKVLLARALVQEPELIVLDEPTVHLDVRHKIEVVSILKKLCRDKNITVILSLHEIDLALKSCDTAMLVKDGQILDYGPPEEVIREDTIKNLYDINSAKYNDFLGTIEFGNKGEDSVFVIGGSGSGTRLYRILGKKGLKINTGVIHENDIDYYIAKSMGAVIASERPFEDISTKSYRKAIKMLNKNDVVVDAGSCIGRFNKLNLNLIMEAVNMGKEVISLRNKVEARKLYREYAKKMTYCDGIASFIEKLSVKGVKSVDV